VLCAWVGTRFKLRVEQGKMRKQIDIERHFSGNPTSKLLLHICKLSQASADDDNDPLCSCKKSINRPLSLFPPFAHPTLPSSLPPFMFPAATDGHLKQQLQQHTALKTNPLKILDIRRSSALDHSSNVCGSIHYWGANFLLSAYFGVSQKRPDRYWVISIKLIDS
jgi:hypothetical protein